MNNSKTRRNFFSMDLSKYNKTWSENVKKTLNILNNDKLVIVTWLKNTWKLNFIKEFINKTSSNNSYFYFNKFDDLENDIVDGKSLENLLNEYIKLYKIPKIIILQNISKIEWVKDFIAKIYKNNYKTILVWNNIKIWWIKEVEILNNTKITNENILDTLKYWWLNDINKINDLELKEKYLNLTTNDIFLNDIFMNFWVKNIYLYNHTMTYLALNNNFYSLRELQRSINDIKNISLKTLIDYIDFSIQEKIIKRVYKYDIKNNKHIKTKAKYYFTDNWIRNSLTNYNLNKKILIENLIYNKLEYNNYAINSGLNWKFEFSFYAVRDTAKLYIHISKQTTKEELKKEVNKLLKIWEIWKKYLIVESAEKLGIKKLQYDSVEIIEINEFLERY